MFVHVYRVLGGDRLLGLSLESQLAPCNPRLGLRATYLWPPDLSSCDSSHEVGRVLSRPATWPSQEQATAQPEGG